MTGGNLDEFPEVLKLLSEITNEGKRIELSKELIDFVDKAFAAHNRELDETVVTEALTPLFKGKEQTMIKTMFEKMIDEGVAIGEVKAGRNLVLKGLRKKFKKVPKEIERSILAMSDPIALESMLEHVFDSNTLDEFAAML
jgi:hypothetical protein